MQRIPKAMAAAVVFAALATALIWALLGPPQPATAQSGGVTNFDSVTVDRDLIVGDDVTIADDLTVAGTIAAAAIITDGDLVLPGTLAGPSGVLTVTGDLYVSDDATVVDDLTVGGQIATTQGAVTVTDNLLVDGQADVVQLTVQGNGTQTALPFVVENSAGTDQFTVSNTGDATAADDLIVTDDATVNDLFVSDWTRVVPQAAISVTMNAIITPTGSYQPLESAGTVNTASIATGTAGDLLVLENTAATSIVLTDTGTLKLSGNLTLGQYDSVTLLSDGTNWVQLATSNN